MAWSSAVVRKAIKALKMTTPVMPAIIAMILYPPKVVLSWAMLPGSVSCNQVNQSPWKKEWLSEPLKA